MQQFTNRHNLDLVMAVWLADSNYDHSNTPDFYHQSVTNLGSSIRQIILEHRALSQPPTLDQLPDVLDQLAVRLGQNIHTGIEDAWTKRMVKNLKAMSHLPKDIYKQFSVNRDKKDKPYTLLFEQRYSKKLLNFTISGGVDLIVLINEEGTVNDFKSSAVYGYIRNPENIKYQKQLSRYRWLRPDLITEELGKLHYIFKDWKAGDSERLPNYPELPILTKTIELTDVNVVESELVTLLTELEKYKDMDEVALPYCTDEELGIGRPTYKYS